MEKKEGIKQKVFWKMQILTKLILTVKEKERKKNRPHLSSIRLKECGVYTGEEVSLIRTFSSS